MAPQFAPSKFFILTFSILSLCESAHLIEPLLCQKPAAWMVDEEGVVSRNGAVSPMNETMGSVTLVSLLRGSSSNALQQASR